MVYDEHQMRAPTADELKRLLDWTSGALGAEVAGFQFGLGEKIRQFIDGSRTINYNRSVQFLPLLYEVYNRSSRLLEIDCAVASILLKAYEANNRFLTEYFPALVKIQGNTLVAVTTTLSQDPESMLRKGHHSISSALLWIAPVKNSAGNIEWWNFGPSGFRIAATKEAWGAYLVRRHTKIQSSAEGAREVIFEDRLPSNSSLPAPQRSLVFDYFDTVAKLHHLNAKKHKEPIEAVYQ